jgi:hypothetical protein
VAEREGRVMPAFEITAAHAGVCPLCSVGIAANRSTISPLPVPYPMNPAYASFYGERGAWLVNGDYIKRMHRRPWAHSRCVDRLNDRYTDAEQMDLAEDWAQELAEMKAEALHIHGRRNGARRQRKPRRPRHEAAVA